MSAVERAEVAELEDALDSKSSGALPRAGSNPAFGIRAPSAAGAVHDIEGRSSAKTLNPGQS
jgi:hypothetical protein